MKLFNNLSLQAGFKPDKNQFTNIFCKNTINLNATKNHTDISIDFSLSSKTLLRNDELTERIKRAQEASSVVQIADSATGKITEDLMKLRDLVSKVPLDGEFGRTMNEEELAKFQKYTADIDKTAKENNINISNILKNDKTATISTKTTSIDKIINLKYKLEGEGSETTVKSVSSLNNSCLSPNVAFSGGSGAISVEPASYIVRGNTGTVSVGGSLVINGEEIELTDNFPMTKLAEHINNNKEKFGVTAELLESYGVKDTNLKLTAIGQPGEDSKLTIEYKNGIHPEGYHAGKLNDAVVYGKTVMSSGVSELAKPATYIVRGNTGAVSVGGTLSINGQDIKVTDNFPMTKLAEYINNNKEKFGVKAELLESYGVNDTNLKLTSLDEASPQSKLSIEYKNGIHPEGPHAGKLHDTVVYGSDLKIVPGEGFMIDGKASKEGDFVVKGNTVTITKEGNSKGLVIDFSKAGADIQHGVAITGASYERHTTTITDSTITIGSKNSDQYTIELKDMSSEALGLDNDSLKEINRNVYNLANSIETIDKAIAKVQDSHNYFKGKNDEINKKLDSLLKESRTNTYNDFNLHFGLSIDSWTNKNFTEMFVKINAGLSISAHSNMMSQCRLINPSFVRSILG